MKSQPPKHEDEDTSRCPSDALQNYRSAVWNTNEQEAHCSHEAGEQQSRKAPMVFEVDNALQIPPGGHIHAYRGQASNRSCSCVGYTSEYMEGRLFVTVD